ncbi:hypothetical protein Enr8_20660 [Blastopirellula retiformator]|uniref:Uncharacterized protein n=1 Tax=Blastopirellula retiformator TaxID=2527970 RepID=A0A5C5V9P6_9BACT|nr:hypothetical protein Enr8_20660 [Blastopirellula retiformator]
MRDTAKGTHNNDPARVRVSNPPKICKKETDLD